MQAAAPDTLNELAAHDVQLVEPELLNVPAAQDEQVKVPSTLKLPAAQVVHFLPSVFAVPAGHLDTHCVDPATLTCVPVQAVQEVLVLAAALNVPASHLRQAFEVESA